MRPPTRLLLLIVLALGTAVGALDARLFALERAGPVVVPLTTCERIPHIEPEELDAVPVAMRVPAPELARSSGFDLRFVSAAEIGDGVVGRREFRGEMLISTEFQVFRPRGVEDVPYPATAALVPATELTLSTNLVGLTRYGNADELETPVFQILPTSREMAAHVSDERLQ